MNARQAIQPSNDPVVLSLQFSPSRNRFIAGLSSGCRLLRADNCLTTYQPTLSASEKAKNALLDGGIGVVAVLDDRYLAFVKDGRRKYDSPNTFFFWDALNGELVTSYNLHEPIIAIRISSRYLTVVLLDRAIVFEYQKLDSSSSDPSPPSSPSLDDPDSAIAPNKVHSLHRTSTNQYGLASLQVRLLALPAQTTGQVQLIPLPSGSKRVFRAHNTELRALALSDDGKIVATASVQGTLLRVFDTTTLDQIAEFRRGMDHAIIYSLAISPGNRFIACTSDKGTLHVFDLKPGQSSAGSGDAARTTTHRSSMSGNTLRSPSGTVPPSLNSITRSSPPASVQYQGSVQEYYGLLPPPPSAAPATQGSAISALGAFKNSAFAPKALRDTRSVASAPFWLGDERPHWQGGNASSWTTAPDGTKRKVKMPVLPLANDPSGRPPKGILAFAPEKARDDGAVLYVLGGGSDARWEKFEIVRVAGNQSGWTLHNHGCRKFMTRQFVD